MDNQKYRYKVVYSLSIRSNGKSTGDRIFYYNSDSDLLSVDNLRSILQINPFSNNEIPSATSYEDGFIDFPYFDVSIEGLDTVFTLTASEKEKDALLSLAKGKDMTPEAILKQALRLYQHVDRLMANNEPVVLGFRLSKLTGDVILNQISGKALEAIKQDVERLASTKFLTELEAKDGKATPGPWVYGENGISYVETVDQVFGPDKNLSARVLEYLTRGDGELICHLRNNSKNIAHLVKVLDKVFEETFSGTREVPKDLWEELGRAYDALD